MRRAIRKRIRSAVIRTVSGMRCQRFWECVYRLSIACMNVGNGANCSQNGEEHAVRELVARGILGNGSVVFDVGANTGEYAIALRRLLPGAEIHCFEPAAGAFGTLRERIAEQDAGTGRFKLNGFGLSDRAGSPTLYSDWAGSTLASLYDRKLDHLGIRLAGSETVRLETLDGYCAGNRIERIDLVKMDIEGNELNALRGSAGMLANVRAAD